MSVAGVIVIAIIVLVGLGVGRMAWGVMRGDRELESGGSMGHQMTGRLDDADADSRD